MDETLTKLVEALEKASPTVWAAAQEAVRADIVVGTITSIIAVLVAILGIALWMLGSQTYDEDKTVVGIVLTVVGAAGALIAGLSTYHIYAAPTWAAVKHILDVIK